jgi:hypothetical protein
MKVKGERTLWGLGIDTMHEFIEDLCHRISSFYSKVRQEENRGVQLSMLMGFFGELKHRLKRVCEK